MTKISNKRANETFLVAKASQAWYNTAGGGNLINNVSTGAVRLADGQLGLFAGNALGSVGLNVATDATPVLAEAPVVYYAQGTQWSANPAAPSQAYPLWNEPFVRSGNINGRNPVLITRQDPTVGTHSVWVIGSTVTGRQITALDNTEYNIRIGFNSVRDDQAYHPGSQNFITGAYVTPNYTTLATQDPVDHLIQNLVWDINRKSKAIAINKSKFGANSNVVALAINVAGDSNGTAIGEDGDGAGGTTALAAGDIVPVINTNVGVRSITLTEAMATSIKNAALAAATAFAGAPVVIADLTWNILTVDTTTAGLTANGVADLIMLVSLDHTPAFKDTIPQIRTRLHVGLPAGFDFTSVANTEYEEAVEPLGQYRELSLWYKATHGQRRYNLNHVEDPIIEFPVPFVDGTQYVTFITNHYDLNMVDTASMVDSPQQAIVCVPSTESTLLTAFTNSMNSWLASNGHPNIDTL